MIVQNVSLICLIVIYVCIGLNLIRVIKGPTLADRALALDGITLNLIGIVTLYSIYLNTALYFDLVIVFSLLGFVGTICFAKFLGRGRIIE